VCAESLFELRQHFAFERPDDGFVFDLFLCEALAEGGEGWAFCRVDTGDLNVCVEALVELAEFL